MDSWEELDIVIKKETIDSEVKSGMLLAKIVSLQQKGFTGTCEEIQQELLAKYNVEYELSDIENELICLNSQEYLVEILEMEEDFFEGY
jgi:hypothetical protein